MILITGGSGMIGRYCNGLKPTHSEFDVCDYNSMCNYASKYVITTILHCAGVYNRDLNVDTAKKYLDLNIYGVINITKLAKLLNVPLIFISSSTVFYTDNYIEFSKHDTPNPHTFYGCSKYYGEEICRLYDKSIIVRSGSLYGGISNNKFVENCTIQLLKGEKVSASNDFFGNITYVVDFVNTLYTIVNNPDLYIGKTYHIANGGSASGYEIALEICKLLNVSRDLINGVDSLSIPDPGQYRGVSEVLISDFTMRDWRDALCEYIYSKFL